MTLAYTFWQTFIAWWALAAIVIFLLVWVAGILTRISAWINPPPSNVDLTLQQMYAENVNVKQDPTIPVGDFNPKHVSRKEFRR